MTRELWKKVTVDMPNTPVTDRLRAKRWCFYINLTIVKLFRGKETTGTLPNCANRLLIEESNRAPLTVRLARTMKSLVNAYNYYTTQRVKCQYLDW